MSKHRLHDLPPKIRVTEKRLSTHRLEIAGSDLVELLNQVGYVIPEGSKVIVHVPGGGDWSDTDMILNDGHPVVITWESVEMVIDGKKAKP